MFAELYVRAKLIVPGDSQATAQMISENQLLFRAGFVSDLLMQTAFFFLVLVLYQLLRRINAFYARMMVAAVLVSVAIMCLNMLTQFGALLAVSRNYITDHQSAEWAAIMMDLHKNGYRIAQIFFGIWLYPLGYLVYKSGWIPRWIGIGLMVACFSFLLDFVLYFMIAEYSANTSAVVTFPTVIAEFSICLWLLIKGVNVKTESLTIADL